MNPTLVAIVTGIVLAFRAMGAIPPGPADPGKLFHDRAGIVDEADARAIRNLQQDALQQSGVPIMIVTIRRMDDYLPAKNIESFARSWFDTWRIGGYRNEGMLVLVSVEDRKSRIQLGSAWGRRFDGVCESLMQNRMVPRFKEGDYGGGLARAVEGLAGMAAAGPESTPPKQGITGQINEAIPLLTHPLLRGGLGALGVISLLLAIRGRKNRRSWLTVSSITLGFAVLTGLMLPALVLWVLFGPALEFFGLSVGGGMWDRWGSRSGSGWSGHNDSWSSGSSGGGGDSGGGASGDW